MQVGGYFNRSYLRVNNTPIDEVGVARDEPHAINAPFSMERFRDGFLIDEAPRPPSRTEGGMMGTRALEASFEARRAAGHLR